MSQPYTIEELLAMRWRGDPRHFTLWGGRGERGCVGCGAASRLGWLELGAPAWSGSTPVCGGCATERVAQMDARLQRREPEEGS